MKIKFEDGFKCRIPGDRVTPEVRKEAARIRSKVRKGYAKIESVEIRKEGDS